MAATEETFLSHLLQVIIAAAFGAWAWVVKVAADRHLSGMDKIHEKLEKHSNRLTKVETHLELEDDETEDDR